MPCDMRMARELLPEKLAEQGWSEEEIGQLELELELAVQTAKRESYENGDTLAQQRKKINAAEKRARKVAHDRMHAKLDGMMQEIRELGDAKEIPDEAKKDKVH